MILPKFRLYLFVLFTAILRYAESIKINFVTDTYNRLDVVFNLMIENFNKYANETNKDIQLELTYFTDVNNFAGYNDYSATLRLFGKKNNKYDVFAYDANYLSAFSPYLLELDNYIEKKHLDLYSTKNNKAFSYYDNHVRGIPFFSTSIILFSNNKYLKKYNKKIPKTWDELLYTTKYILDEEIRLYNNTNLMGYAGLFPSNENTMCSLYQLIYSFRDTKDSEIPEFTSQNAIDAVNKILEIRDKISSNELFRLPETQIVEEMLKENILFANFYDSVGVPNYSMSVQPGKNKGINSSIMGGYSLGIYKLIDEKKKEAALEVIKYLTSKEFQKEVVIKQLRLTSFLEELYDDPEACEYINCEMLHEIQYFLRPISTIKQYDDFSKRAIRYFQDLLDGKKTVEETLTDIDDINRVYYLTIYSTVGGVILSLLVTILVIILSSTCLIFIPSFKKYFSFLSKDLWIIYTIGAILILGSAFGYYYLPSKEICILRRMLHINGESLIFIPLVYELTINFPLVNKFSEFVRSHKYTCICYTYSLQLLLTVLNTYFGAFNIKEVNHDNNNKNFYICENENTIGKAFTQVQYLYTIILYVSICILLFFEWNIKKIFFDVRHFTIVMIINGISKAFHYLFNYININNYILYNSIFILIISSYVIMNHIYIFTLRILLLHRKQIYYMSEEKIIKDKIHNNKPGSGSLKNSVVNKLETEEYSSKGSLAKSSDKLFNSNDLKSKLLNIHYMSSQNLSSLSQSC